MTTDSRAAQLAAMRQAESNYHKMADACPWHCPQDHVHTVAILRDMHLDAVYPLIEAEVREQVAKEIELAVEIVMEHEIRDDLYTRSALQASMRAFGWAIAAIARGKDSE